MPEAVPDDSVDLPAVSSLPVKSGILCGLDGCDYVGVSPQAVGMHRFHVHGIRSRSHKKASEVVATIKGDDIVNVVLSQLYPNGIPVDKIRSVLEWAQHTDRFVEEIRG